MDAEALWNKLGTIYLDNEERLETDFEHFPKGTHVTTVWNWFRTNFPDFSVAEHSWKETIKKYNV